jgi:hypothetical protein
MNPGPRRGYRLSVALSTAIAVLACADAARAQPSAIGPADRGDPINQLNRKAAPIKDGSGGTTEVPKEPYEGQIYCPVTGKKLGLKQEPVKVQTSIGEQQPGFFARIFGKKPTPGAVIYVCCPQCAEKVRTSPYPYYSTVVVDRGTLSSYSYATAPAQRPAANGPTSKPLPTTAANGDPARP